MIDTYNISAEHYEALYERFLSRSPDDLLSYAGPIKGKRVLDICAGGMRVAKRAVELGASYVVAIDKSDEMTASRGDVNCVLNIDIRNINSYLIYNDFDVAICQQGINYWFNAYTISKIADVVKKEGYFIFNTFNKKPDVIPAIKQYGGFDGKEFTEITQLVGDEIYHLQMRNGYSPHFTSFKWLAPDDIENVLNTYFYEVNSIVDKNTTIYVCQK